MGDTSCATSHHNNDDVVCYPIMVEYVARHHTVEPTMAEQCHSGLRKYKGFKNCCTIKFNLRNLDTVLPAHSDGKTDTHCGINKQEMVVILVGLRLRPEHRHEVSRFSFYIGFVVQIVKLPQVTAK